MRPITFATPTPSFQIAGAAPTAAPVLRLDQINSQEVLLAARRVLFQYMQAYPMGADPLGVVLPLEGAPQRSPGSTIQAERAEAGRVEAGRVVFRQPILLPNEQFVAIEWLRGRHRRGSSSRLRMPRPGAPSAWSGESA